MKQKPTILAIDSSSGACSVAIWKNGVISAYCEELSASLQSKRLIAMTEEILDKSNTLYSDLTLIACTVGPGSFTGIRIGLASARGIGFATGIPVLGFNSLEVMAFGMRGGESKFAIINAGKGEFVYQYFDRDMLATCPPTLNSVSPEPKNSTSITFPRADLLAELAAIYPEHGVEPLPFYVRPPDAKLPENNNVATT